MKRFDGFDFLSIEDHFSEDERLVRDTVRSFVEEQIIPIIHEHYDRATFPAHLIKPLAELGVFGATISGYGCAGINNVAYGLMMQELERGDSGFRSFASVQSSLVMYPVYTFGDDKQKEKWLTRLARAESIGCFGLTEPDFGSNPGGLVTAAVEDGNEYVLNGGKMWITNGSLADVAIVWAKMDGEIYGFIVERDRPGFEAKEMKYKLSLRASDTSELVLSDCRVPKANLLPGSKGLRKPLMCLNQARYGIAWGALGAAMACFHEALEYSKERIQFDKPIASFQLTQRKLADMATEITLGQLMAVQLGRLKDQGKETFQQVSMAKRNNVRKALEVARLGRSILGANGISGEYQCMRHMCNLESVDTYEGTYEIHTLIVGHDLTGIEAYS